MQKIPTVFKRDPDDMRRVLPEITPGCEWVLAGEGVATRKYDGTCVMFDGERWLARREVKPGKQPPADFRPISTDENTGKTVGWEPIEASGFSKWHAEAVEPYPGDVAVVGTYELCGPKINGNPEGFAEHVIVRHSAAERIEITRPALNFDDLRTIVLSLGDDGWEGIVWHHPDGRMAKLKRRDFPAS